MVFRGLAQLPPRSLCVDKGVSALNPPFDLGDLPHRGGYQRGFGEEFPGQTPVEWILTLHSRL